MNLPRERTYLPKLEDLRKIDKPLLIYRNPAVVTPAKSNVTTALAGTFYKYYNIFFL